MFINIPVSIVVFIFIQTVSSVVAHIGGPCNSLLKICLPSGIFNPNHMYCDVEDNICKCKAEYPVQVGPHSCKKPQKNGGRCSHTQECQYHDKNSYCTQTPYTSQCECHFGFVYDGIKAYCVKDEKPKRPTSNMLFLPSAAGFLMACLSVLCCCVVIWHNICRRRPSNDWSTQGENVHLRRRDQRMLESPSTLINSNATRLSSRESAVCDEPPPSYEDAIKMNIEYNDQLTGTTTTAINAAKIV